MRMRPRSLGQALLALFVAAACGGASTVATISSTPTPTPHAIPKTPQATPTPTPTPHPLPNGQLIVLVEAGAATNGVTGSLRLVTLGGQVVADYPIEQGATELAVAGNRVFVATQGGELKAIDRDGTVEDLGPLGTCCPNLVPSPDGKRWIWGTNQSRAGSSEISSQIHEAGDGLADRVVEQLVSANSGTPGLPGYSVARYLIPYAWTAGGVFIAHGFGVGGYLPFGFFFTPMDRLDLETGKVTALSVGDECFLGDVARDGTIACFVRGDQASTLRLAAPNDGTKEVTLARPQFNLMGDAWFDPSGIVLTVAGATGVGGMGPDPQPEVYTTYLVKLDGSIVQFGPAGARPALRSRSWLSSQQLVLWRPSGAAGGQTGLYVLDISGRGNFIADPGRPIGVLS
jgi:hypothetical protein